MRLASIAVIIGLVTAGSQPALAYSEKVKNACKNDYMTHCNTYEVGSAALKQCMRKAGPKLEPKCVDALVDAGEVSAQEVASRRAAKN